MIVIKVLFPHEWLIAVNCSHLVDQDSPTFYHLEMENSNPVFSTVNLGPQLPMAEILQKLKYRRKIYK